MAIRPNNTEINSKSSTIVIRSRLHPFDTDNDLQPKLHALQHDFDNVHLLSLGPGTITKEINRVFNAAKQTKSSNNSPNKLRGELKPVSMTSVSNAERFLTLHENCFIQLPRLLSSPRSHQPQGKRLRSSSGSPPSWVQNPRPSWQLSTPWNRFHLERWWTRIQGEV